MGARAYVGKRTMPNGLEWAVIMVDRRGRITHLPPRNDLFNHSPDGFSWGYSGSGPAQLALALLAHHLDDDDDALRLYQAFKDAVVAAMDQESDWTLTADDINRGIAAAEGRIG